MGVHIDENNDTFDFMQAERIVKKAIERKQTDFHEELYKKVQVA